MRKYVTFIVSFLMLFISALPISRTTEAKQEEAIAMTKSSSPIILKHADQVFQQNGDDIQNGTASFSQIALFPQVPPFPLFVKVLTT